MAIAMATVLIEPTTHRHTSDPNSFTLFLPSSLSLFISLAVALSVSHSFSLEHE